MNAEYFLQNDIKIKEEFINSSSYPDPENESAINRARSTRNRKKYNTKKHFGRMTQEQVQFYIEFSQKHTEMFAGKYLYDKSLWEQLANQLNAFRGPKRTARKWRESLSHRKNQLRCRARRDKRNLKETENEQSSPSLMEFEQQDLTIPPTLPKDNHLQKQEASIIEPAPSGKQKKKAEKPRTARISASYVDELHTLSLQPLQNDTDRKHLKNDDDDDFLTSTIDTIPTELRLSPKQLSSPCPATDLQASAEGTNPSNMEKISIQKICKLTLESIKARDERDERMLAQQGQLTKALEQLTQAVVKLSEKLERIH